MAWTIVITVAAAVAVAFLVVFLLRSMKVPREPDREGAEDEEAVRAYDRISRWPLFALERLIIRCALKSRPPRGLVLDVGCGPGYLAANISRQFGGNTVIGLDIDDRKLTIAGRNWPAAKFGNLSFIVGDAHRLPFADGSIDFAASSLALHHWADALKALREIRRVLKPSGRFLIFDLRRDGRRFFYYALRVGQVLFAPAVLKRTNGAVGSFWASYTGSELEAMLTALSFGEYRVVRRFGWLQASGRR